jgi:hypothetical protein
MSNSRCASSASLAFRGCDRQVTVKGTVFFVNVRRHAKYTYYNRLVDVSVQQQQMHLCSDKVDVSICHVLQRCSKLTNVMLPTT